MWVGNRGVDIGPTIGIRELVYKVLLAVYSFWNFRIERTPMLHSTELIEERSSKKSFPEFTSDTLSNCSAIINF